MVQDASVIAAILEAFQQNTKSPSQVDSFDLISTTNYTIALCAAMVIDPDKLTPVQIVVATGKAADSAAALISGSNIVVPVCEYCNIWCHRNIRYDCNIWSHRNIGHDYSLK